MSSGRGASVAGSVKALVTRALRPLARLIAREVVRRQVEVARARRRRATERLQVRGDRVKIAADVMITYPEAVAIGPRVEIAGGARLISEGGVTVGSGSYIGAHVTISTIGLARDERGAEVRQPRPVAIGPGAFIGAGSLLLPGARVPSGSIVPPGAVVPVTDASRGVVEDSDGFAPTPVPVSEEEESGDQPDVRRFFVVTTGRSGSTSVARILSQHSRIRCHHERRPQLVRLATEYAHGEKTIDEVRREVVDLYGIEERHDRAVYGESDPKLFNLIGILADFFPSSVFVWLIRDGRDVVASTVGRRWYTEYETETADPTAHLEWPRYAHYRLDGARCGAVSPAEWRGMSTFERNCWRWTYVNETIESQLGLLADDRWTLLRVEEIDPTLERCFSLLGVEPEPVTLLRENVADYSVREWRRWDERRRDAFERWCGAGMDRWYPAWQEGWRAPRSA